MPQVFIVDYGVGNLLSLKFALEKAGLKVKISAPTQKIKDADAIALPGVGNFSAAAKETGNAVKVMDISELILASVRG